LRRIAVIDSTPLISLAHLDLATELVHFFDVIYVPSAVQSEVNRKQKFRYRLNKLYKRGIFQKCTSADKFRVELLKAELDDGEAEALIQAQERNAHYFIGDEKRARQIGEALGLKPVGTVRILARLNLESRAAETNSLVQKLKKDLRFRVSNQVVEQAIAIATEPI
jgi:predicted nucleic acid-binding protein